MKKILLILSLFISVFSKGQVTPLPKPSTVMPFGLIDVRSFGAIGDSSTDNTAAFRAAFAEAARFHTAVFIPSGNWVVTDSVIISQRVGIWGAGGQVNNNNELGAGTGEIGFAQTNILMQGNNKSVFVIDPLDTGSIAISNTGNTFKDFAIIYQGTTPTSNAGIRMIDGGSYDMYNVSISNFWIDLDVLASAYPNLLGCHFNNYAFVGVKIQNTRSPDWGGTTMTNCTILTGKYAGAYAGLLWGGSGAFRMSNCEFNLTDLTHITKYCIVLDNSVQGATQEIYFDNTSLSAFDSAAFFAVHLAPLTKGIFLNNMYAYGPITDSANQAAFQFNTASTTIQQIHLSNLTAASNVQNKSGFQPPVISCTNTQLLTVTNITHGQYYTGPDVLCTNCQTSTSSVKDLGLNTGFQDANGQPQYVRIGSKFGIDFWVNDTLTPATAGPFGIRFFNGNGIVASMNGGNVWSLCSANPAVFNNTTPQVYVEKDTAAKVGIIMRNATSGATASAAFILAGVNATLNAYTTTSTFTPFKNVRASSTALEADGSGNMDILYNGGSFSLGNGQLSTPEFNITTGHNIGINNSTPGGMLTLGSGPYNQPNNAAAGNLISTTAFLIGNTTTAASGTVAQYAVNAFGINSLSASNTSVTYTNASTFYIGGPPTASTNLTITNPWSLFINTGAAEFAAPTTTVASINLPAGTAKTSPVQGDLFATSGHLFYRDGSTTFDLLAATTPTFQQTLTAGSTLTGANTITTSAGNLQITLGTSNFILNGPGLIEQQNTAATFTYASEIGTSVTSHYGWGYLTPGNGGSFTHGIVEYDSLMNVTFPANVSFTGAGSFIMPIGNTLKVTEGAGGRCGQVALTSGTKAISISGVTTSSRAFVSLVSQSGTVTTTVAYIGVCTSNTLTISAVTVAGTNTINTSDASTLNYFIVN